MTEPGIYDMSAADYHADPALGHSGAVTLMNECPARFRYERDNRPEIDEAKQKALDVGRATHLAILEPTWLHKYVASIDADDWRSKAARESRDAARAKGVVPMLARDLEDVLTMSRAVHDHPIAGRLLTDGVAEQSVFWRDERHGVMRKCRPDYRRAEVVVDLKTALSAHPVAAAKAAYRDHWWSQQDWYEQGLSSAGLGIYDFLFVVVEKDPPHFVAVYRLPPSARQWGSMFNGKAVERFAECQRTNTWPDYARDISLLELPSFAEFQLQDRHAREEFTPKPAKAAVVQRGNDFLAPPGRSIR